MCIKCRLLDYCNCHSNRKMAAIFYVEIHILAMHSLWFIGYRLQLCIPPLSMMTFLIIHWLLTLTTNFKVKWPYYCQSAHVCVLNAQTNLNKIWYKCQMLLWAYTRPFIYVICHGTANGSYFGCKNSHFGHSLLKLDRYRPRLSMMTFPSAHWPLTLTFILKVE